MVGPEVVEAAALVERIGAMGVLLVVILKLVPALNRVSRVLWRIEARLGGEPDTDTPERLSRQRSE